MFSIVTVIVLYIFRQQRSETLQLEQRNLGRTRRTGHRSGVADVRNIGAAQCSGRCCDERGRDDSINDGRDGSDGSRDVVDVDDEQRQEGHEQLRRSKVARTTQRY